MDRLKLLKERHAARKITEEFITYMVGVNDHSRPTPVGDRLVSGHHYEQMTDHDVRHELGLNFSTIENQGII